MSQLAKRVAALSAEKRELLMQRLKEIQPAPQSPGAEWPRMVPAPERRHEPFPLTDVQKAYWAGRSGLFDLGTCANIYLEYEIVYQMPPHRWSFQWTSLLYWALSTFGQRYLERKITRLFLERFNAALPRLIERHEMMRAVILPDGGQRILEQVPPYQAPIVDLRGKTPQVVEQTLERVRERMRYQKTGVETWPLFEFVVCLLAGYRIRLLVRIDPLIIDGSSRRVFIPDLSRLLVNPSSTLPPLECSYRDYAVTLEAFRQHPQYQRSRDYWLRLLPAMPLGPELPLAQPISPQTPVRFTAPSLTLLDPGAWQRLKTRAARAGLTASGALMAAFTQVLQTWSCDSHFTLGLIGTYHPPFHPQLHTTFGNFNTISLLEVRPGGDTFERRAQLLQQRLLADMEHLHFSGHALLAELNRKYGGTTRATVPIFFNSVIDSYHQPGLPELGPDDGRVPDSADRYRLITVEVGAYIPQLLLMPVFRTDPAGALQCKWQVAEGILPDGLSGTMLEAYRQLLQSLADDERSWSATTRQLTPAAHLAQWSALNQTEAQRPAEMLQTLVASWSLRQPERPAVIASGQVLSYGMLYRYACRVGHCLRALGARPNMPVAVIVDKGWEQVVAALGVLLSGAAYLPLDPGLPADELRSRLEHGEVALAVTTSRLEQRVSWPADLRRMCIEAEALLSHPDHPLDPLQTALDIAYILPTAGSTGRPKDVIITHAGIANTILSINERFAVGPEDRVLALAPVCSDLSIYDTFGILAAGGAVVFPDAAAETDPLAWAQAIREQQITVWNSPPALLEQLLDAVAEHPEQLGSSLRLAFLSRDWIPLTLPGRARALSSSIQVISLGGAVEAALWSSVYPVHEIAPGWKSIPYGRPLQNQRLYVLDEMLEPRPLWVPGQLYIGGDGLAQGYWRDETTTRAHFVTYPHTGERLFRTGDIARLLPDGQVELISRADATPAMISGYRVAPRQVEAVLEQHPALRRAVVACRQNGNNRGELIAYVVYQSQAATHGELCAFLRHRLPEHMLPTTFVALDALPLTRNGAVDRWALRAPPAAEIVDMLPRDELEAQLVRLWQHLLQVPSVGIADDFFALGGTSFLITRLLSDVQTQFGRELPLGAFIRRPTIAHMADLLRGPVTRPEAEDTKSPALPRSKERL